MRGTLVIILFLVIGFLIGSFTNTGSRLFSFLKTGEFNKTSVQNPVDLISSTKNAINEITNVAQKETGAVFDKQYLDAMITMYEGSVALSKIGTVASGRSELRTTAKSVAKDDAAILNQLKTWRAQWYPETKTETVKPNFVK